MTCASHSEGSALYMVDLAERVKRERELKKRGKGEEREGEKGIREGLGDPGSSPRGRAPRR